jgi:hypothetical protein
LEFWRIFNNTLFIFLGHGIVSIFAAKIAIKRVFRGFSGLQSQEVIVENLGNPRICLSTPKIGDTRLFFTDQLILEDFHFPGDKMPHFKLRSSLLRLTLPNLRVLWKLKKFTKKGKTINRRCPKFQQVQSVECSNPDRKVGVYMICIFEIKFIHTRGSASQISANHYPTTSHYQKKKINFNFNFLTFLLQI